ncbi:MAG: DoxX family protein, partial [Nanoarchaeota archaeon]
MTAISYDYEMSKEAFRNLGYPIYLMNMLTLFKVFGSLALIIPQIPTRIKEWAYAGFTFDILGASASFALNGGKFGDIFFPLVLLAVMFVSYFSWKKV